MVWDWSNKWWSSWMSQREILPYQEPSDVTVHLYSVHEPFCQFNFSCSLENDSNPSIPIALWHHCTIVQCAMHTVHGPYRLFNFSSFLANDAKWEILPYQEPSVVTEPFHLFNRPSILANDSECTESSPVLTLGTGRIVSSLWFLAATVEDQSKEDNPIEHPDGNCNHGNHDTK